MVIYKSRIKGKEPAGELIYTGIGSRSAPPESMARMKAIGYFLAKAGWVLRSGGADGADSAFEDGCDRADGWKEIYLPWKGFNKKEGYYDLCDHAFELAELIHPAWDACSDGAKRLHARNTYQVLGALHDEPSKLVICWTKDGKLSGGTRTALVIARNHKIPIINLADDNSYAHWSASQILDKIASDFRTPINHR